MFELPGACVHRLFRHISEDFDDRRTPDRARSSRIVDLIKLPVRLDVWYITAPYTSYPQRRLRGFRLVSCDLLGGGADRYPPVTADGTEVEQQPEEDHGE